VAKCKAEIVSIFQVDGDGVDGDFLKLVPELTEKL